MGEHTPRTPEYPLENPQTGLVLSSVVIASASTLMVGTQQVYQEIYDMKGIKQGVRLAE